LDRKREDCSKYVRAGKQGFYLITLIIIWLVPAAAQGTKPPNLYRQIIEPVLNPAEVYQVRHVSINREDLHIVLSDGTIALMQAVDGHTVGAIFEGAGEVLLVPPDRAERTSLALFTKSGVLDEHFSTAYLRFFDDQLVEELRSGFRPATNGEEFTAHWHDAVQSLAQADGLQLIKAMTNTEEASSRFLHLRVGGSSMGIFDVFFNTTAPDQITVAQAVKENDVIYYNTWVSFPMRSARETPGKAERGTSVRISDFRIHSRIVPPSNLEGETELTVKAGRTGERTLILQLSRYLRVSEARLDGQPIEFIQNEATDGSELARHGNDLIAVIFPVPLAKDHEAKLTIKYSGPVMFDAGGDLLYVGARGIWYPNAGPSFSNFDLTFDYPAAWTLVATGKQVSTSATNGRQTTRFVSEKPIAHAGFNLGKFQTDRATVGGVAVDAYAANNVEATLERSLMRNSGGTGVHPDPARMVQHTARQAAATVQFLNEELTPFPYSRLEITQLPALLSQSWPGLIYLSSVAFLSPQERNSIGLRDPYLELLFSKLMLVHETAHQWWGDAVNCDSYRDEWLIEALANYSALVMLERSQPDDPSIALEYYRKELLKSTPNGIIDESGPVTLGERLISSKFPGSVEPVLYGRGTWLIHMLRSMLRQASGDNNDALFFKALKGLLVRSTNGKISTRDLQHAFEQVLPPALSYEGQHNLDWFFDSWVNGSSIPEFSLEDVRLTPSGAKVRIKGVVREKYAAKDLVTAVPLYSTDHAGHSQFLGFVFADEATTDFQFQAPAGTKDVLLDPARTVLRR
jgi:hypothetical protein